MCYNLYNKNQCVHININKLSGEEKALRVILQLINVGQWLKKKVTLRQSQQFQVKIINERLD